MINRRLLRVKVVQILFAYHNAVDKSLAAAERELKFSIDKSYELYHYFLLLPNELTKHAQKIIDRNKTKKLPSQIDLHPNTRFVDNALVEMLRDNDALVSFQNVHKLSWANHPELIKDLFASIEKTAYFKEFMEGEAEGFIQDKDLWVKIFKKVLPESVALGEVLEEKSIYWNDDAELVLSMAMKTLKGFKPESTADHGLMPLFKDVEDEKYAIKLLHQAILRNNEFQTYIEEMTKHWDMERLAFMDNLIMKVALAEITEFKNIPVKVSLNEYIEIAKSYSTQKSGLFINGVLDNVVMKLKEQKKIVKTGRGLME